MHARLCRDVLAGHEAQSQAVARRSHELVVRITKQNLDVSGGVHDDKEDFEVSTGDQIFMSSAQD